MMELLELVASGIESGEVLGKQSKPVQIWTATLDVLPCCHSPLAGQIYGRPAVRIWLPPRVS